MKKAMSLLASAGIVALTSCGSPEVEPDDHYEEIDDFQQAAHEAGIDCEEESRTSRLNAFFMRCQEGPALVAFKESGAGPDNPSQVTAGSYESYLVSDSWVIGHDDPAVLESAQEILGGEVISPSPLEAAYEECGPSGISFDPDYEVATIDGATRFSNPDATSAYNCLVDELPIPDHVQSDIGRTRALDGTRDAAWDDYEASWTYHPDSGLNIQIEGQAD